MDRRSTDVVSRPRVVDLFRLAIESPVTLVNAPTGYGKTFAVRQFLEVDEHPHAYVTFEPQDDRNTGWHKLLVEMERANIAPGLGTITQLFGDPASIDLGRLATLDEAERLSRTAVVVLDGIDEVREAAAIEEFAFFANRLPPTVRLVALTRRQLGLPVARWRAQSRLAEIGADDLRFDYDETAAVLHSTAADPPLDIDVRALTDRVEGWPLGVATVARWQAEGRPAGDP